MQFDIPRLRPGESATESTAVVLETCSAAVAFGDAREVFTLQKDGEILHIAENKCLGVRDGSAVDGDEVVLSACDKALKWEVRGNGQLKVKASENLCVAQVGSAPGSVDVAGGAAVWASSTANALSHG